LCPRDSSSPGSSFRRERALGVLPPGAFLFLVLPVLLVPALILGGARPSSSQESGSSSTPPPASGGSAPASSGTAPAAPAAPSQGAAAAPAAPPPFVPPLPPGPSQTHLPSAFTLTTPLGSPTARFDFHPTFGFTEEWTDNFRRSEDNRTSNFRSTLRAGFNLLINTPKTTGSVTTSLGVSKDSSDDSADTNFFPSFTGMVRHTFSPRLSLTITDTLTRSDEPSLADTTGLRRERRTFTSNSFSISADWLLDLISTQYYYRNSLFFSEEETMSHVFGINASTRLGALSTLSAGYELSLSDTSRTDSQAFRLGIPTNRASEQSSESIGHTIHASLSRRVGYFGTAGVSSSFSTQSRGDTRIWNVSAFSSYGLPTGLALSGSIGYSRLSTESGGDSSAISANTTASYRFAQAVVALSASQDFRQTFVDGQDFGIVLTRAFSATFSYPLTVFISSNVFARYTETEPTAATVTSVSQRGDQTVKSFSAGFSLSWAILRWLSASLNYTFSERTGGDGSFGATSGGSNDGTIRENRAAIHLNASF
jgi:hypothetical protein